MPTDLVVMLHLICIHAQLHREILIAIAPLFPNISYLPLRGEAANNQEGALSVLGGIGVSICAQEFKYL